MAHLNATRKATNADDPLPFGAEVLPQTQPGNDRQSRPPTSPVTLPTTPPTRPLPLSDPLELEPVLEPALDPLVLPALPCGADDDDDRGADWLLAPVDEEADPAWRELADDDVWGDDADPYAALPEDTEPCGVVPAWVPAGADDDCAAAGLRCLPTYPVCCPARTPLRAAAEASGARDAAVTAGDVAVGCMKGTTPSTPAPTPVPTTAAAASVAAPVRPPAARRTLPWRATCRPPSHPA